jgi:proteasome accessory factor B
MASEKNERLVNLTIALLATKKYLTKAQIFKLVEGYGGSAEAADRMFERDKEELRGLGINIEMKSIDALFDDEIGYRISPDRYRFDVGQLSPEEVSILALAAEAWKESALKDVARSTSIRLESLGINADFSEIHLAPTIATVPENISDILESIESNKVIEMNYVNQDDDIESKKVAPLGLYSQKGKWYLFATDTKIDQNRSYRLDRIDGAIKKTQKSFNKQDVVLPSMHFPEVETILKIRRDHALAILENADVISEDDEWITCQKSFESENVAISQILLFSPNIQVLQPISVVSGVTKALNELWQIYAN